MHIVDSSGWREYFAAGPNADVFSTIILQYGQFIVSAITITEVFRRVLQQRDETVALQAAAHMTQGCVVGLDAGLAMTAAKLGHELKLPLADSIILATAQAHQAVLWTQDADFADVPGVRYIKKHK